MSLPAPDSLDAVTHDVAVVGCGPVGALAANLLGQAGLSVAVIDREREPHPLPRAVHVDHEMLRLFQSIGLAEIMRPLMRETQGHLHVGADHGAIRYMGTAGQAKPYGWANDYFFYQPELEEALRAGLARFPQVRQLLGTDFTGLQQDADSVTLQLSAGTVRARWVIACDGARSPVRKALDITLDDLGFEEPWLVVDADVGAPVRFPDLRGVPAAADLQQLSVMMCDPARPATIVPGRGSLRRWEFMLLPGEDDTAMMEPAEVEALLRPYLAGVPHTILRAATYRFHGLVAEQWQADRVFLAGDAAHQTPPFFGQGMCHGMRDVANLAWKLALVVRDMADPRMLASYQPERDPHVRAVIDAAVAAGRYICELDPDRAALRDAEIRSRSGQPATAAELIPPIAAGVIAGGTAGAGTRWVQPCLNGTLLDTLTGQGWRMFTRGERPAADALAPVPLAVCDIAALGDDGTLAGWLDRHGAACVLVRPDHYVFGTAVAGGAGALIDWARRVLQLREPVTC